MNTQAEQLIFKKESVPGYQIPDDETDDDNDDYPISATRVGAIYLA